MGAGEDAHPLLHVCLRFHVLDELRSVGGEVGRIDQVEHVRVAAGGILDLPNQPVPPVARQLFGSAGGVIDIQRTPGVIVEVLPVAIELEPRLHFVKISVRVVREMLGDHVPIRDLGVFHHPGAAAVDAPDAVHVEVHVTPVIPRQPQLAHDPVKGLLALNRVVVVGAVARGMNFVEGSRSQKLIVLRHRAVVMARAADR